MRKIAASTLPNQVQKLTLVELKKDSSCKTLFYSVSDMTHPKNNNTQPITMDQIAKLCKLARLDVPSEESMSRLRKDLNEVVSCLNQLPVDIDAQIPPTYSPMQLYGRQNNMTQRWRKDIAQETSPDDLKLLLKHAPFVKANCYVIKTKQAAAVTEEEF